MRRWQWPESCALDGGNLGTDRISGLRRFQRGEGEGKDRPDRVGWGGYRSSSPKRRDKSRVRSVLLVGRVTLGLREGTHRPFSIGPEKLCASHVEVRALGLDGDVFAPVLGIPYKQKGEGDAVRMFGMRSLRPAGSQSRFAPGDHRDGGAALLDGGA